jgi:hypothetical protein
VRTADLELGTLYVISRDGQRGYIIDPYQHYSLHGPENAILRPNDSGKGTHCLVIVRDHQYEPDWIGAVMFTVADYRIGAMPKGFRAALVAPQAILCTADDEDLRITRERLIWEIAAHEASEVTRRSMELRSKLESRGIEPIKVDYDHVVLTHAQVAQLLER